MTGGIERAVAPDGQRLAGGYVDAGIVLGESLDGVAAFEHDGGVARAADTRPRAVRIVLAVDSRTVERQGDAVGDGDFDLRAECAGEHVAILCHIVSGQPAEVSGEWERVGEGAGADGSFMAADGDRAAPA